MKKLFAGYTQYQLLIFLLLKQSDDELIFLLPKYLEDLKKVLEVKYRVEIIEREKPPLKKLIEYLKYYSYIKKLIKKLDISIDTILYGDSIINYAISNKNILCRLEDGTGNYITKAYEEKSSLKQRVYFFIDRIIYFLFFNKILLAEKEKIKKRINKYYVTEIAPKDLWFEDKVIRLKLKELWLKKQEKEKEEILNVFNINIKLLKKIEGRKIIIFTQPLSEDRIICEKEKIKLYTKIINKYDEKEVIIKPHPREKTQYSKYFKNCVILNGNFPSELLYFEGIEISKVVTLFSTAALTFGKNVEIDFYGTEVHEKLLQKFGSCDYIMKRNSYL